MAAKKSKYITAPYRYLSVEANLDVRAAFIRGEIDLPELWHGQLFSIDKFTRRLDAIKTDLHLADSPELKDYYEQRLLQTEFLCAVHKLKHSSSHRAPALLKVVRDYTARLYGVPHRKVAESILGSIQRAAAKGKAEKHELWSYIEQHVNKDLTSSRIERPAVELFHMYRQYFMEYAPWVYAPSETLPKDIIAFSRMALKHIGADKLGWKVEIEPKRTYAHVLYTEKKVWIGEHYHPISWRGMRRTVVHEVYGHVNRWLHSHKILSTADAEGFAVLLEQLLRPKYSMQRSYRYLAIAAGWGTLSRPMNFRQVYEILWRAMRIVSGYPIATAKLKAYNETARAFRIGRPDLPGAVFTKDILYFEGNMQAWRFLATHPMTYNEFVDVLEGRKEAVEEDA